MPSNHPFTPLTSALAMAGFMFIGCGGPSNKTHVPEAEAPSVVVSPTSAREGEQATPGADDTTANPAAETFEPPFPNRTNLFARPNAQKAVGLVRKRQEERGGDLQLKGFVEVDRPRAMLHIDGKLWIAGAGDTRENLRVVAVAPPNVSLMRDGAEIDLSLRPER